MPIPIEGPSSSLWTRILSNKKEICFSFALAFISMLTLALIHHFASSEIFKWTALNLTAINSASLLWIYKRIFPDTAINFVEIMPRKEEKGTNLDLVQKLLNECTQLKRDIARFWISKTLINVIQSPIFKNDKEFIFLAAKNLAIKAPEALCQNLSHLQLDRDDAREVGANLENSDHRARFAEHFKLQTIEEDRENLLKYKAREPHEVLGNGVCFGKTIKKIAKKPSTINARFIQAAYTIRFAVSEKQIKLGKLVLQTEGNKKIRSKINKFFPNINGNYQDVHFHLAGRLTLALVNEIKAEIAEVEKEVEKLEEMQIIAKATNHKELLPIMKEHLNKFKELVALVKELTELGHSIKRSGVLDHVEELPEKFYLKIGIKQGVSILKKTSLNHLEDVLSNYQGDKRKFGLSVWPKQGKRGHCLAVCFNPPSFYDCNSVNAVTGEDRVMKFDSVDEMATALLNHIYYLFGDQFSLFDLTAYT